MLLASSVGFALHLDLAGLQHVGTVGDLQGHFGVLLHQQHGHAVAVDLADDLEDLLDQQRRQAHGRLVQQQHLGLAHQGTAHGQHLLLAAGQVYRPAGCGALSGAASRSKTMS